MDDQDDEVRHLQRLETFYRQRLDILTSRRALLLAWTGLLVGNLALLATALSCTAGRSIASIGLVVTIALTVTSVVVAWQQHP